MTAWQEWRTWLEVTEMGERGHDFWRTFKFKNLAFNLLGGWNMKTQGCLVKNRRLKECGKQKLYEISWEVNKQTKKQTKTGWMLKRESGYVPGSQLKMARHQALWWIRRKGTFFFSVKDHLDIHKFICRLYQIINLKINLLRSTKF